MWWGLPKLRSSRCCLPYGDCWGAGGMQEARWTRKQGQPQTAEVHRNQCSEPRGLHLPIQRMPNSLTWCLIFDAQTACSLCCKLVCSLTPPLAFLEQFSQSYQDVVSQAWSCKHSHQVKWLSTFRSWLYFLVEQLTSLESLWMLNAQQHSSSWCCYRK